MLPRHPADLQVIPQTHVLSKHQMQSLLKMIDLFNMLLWNMKIVFYIPDGTKKVALFDLF